MMLHYFENSFLITLKDPTNFFDLFWRVRNKIVSLEPNQKCIKPVLGLYFKASMKVLDRITKLYKMSAFFIMVEKIG